MVVVINGVKATQEDINRMWLEIEKGTVILKKINFESMFTNFIVEEE